MYLHDKIHTILNPIIPFIHHTVRRAKLFDDFIAIVGSDIFENDTIKEYLFTMLTKAFVDINLKYPIASGPTSRTLKIWETFKKFVISSATNEYIRAKSIGAIINGANEIPENALSTVEQLFKEAFRVS